MYCSDDLALDHKKNTPTCEGGVLLMAGGEGGIRTRGKFDPSHAFQACDLNRSSTSPKAGAIYLCIVIQSSECFAL